MRTDSISFGAKPINNPIRKIFDRKSIKYTDLPAEFVKLEHTDIKAIDNIAETWENAQYAKKIATASHWMQSLPIEIYALTGQKDNFHKLDPTKIFALAVMKPDDKRKGFKWLYYLQVKPEMINVDNNGRKFYRHTGTAMLNSLKRIYSKISLYSTGSKNVKAFYENNGFVEDYTGENHYIWTSNIISRLKLKLEKMMIKFGL